VLEIYDVELYRMNTRNSKI